MVENTLNLINDKAIVNADADGLDFDIYAQTISDTLTKAPSPFSMGIYGTNGSGKTSLLNLIAHKTNEINNKIFNIYYDAWKLESDSKTLLVLLDLLESAVINERYKHHEDVITKILDYINYIKHASLDLNATQLNEKIQSQAMLNASIEVFQLFKALESLLKEHNIQFNIYIDNLEKCKSKNIFKILNSINMIFDLRGFSFILGINKDLLQNKIAKTEVDFYNIMDKFIQLPFYIPVINSKSLNFINSISKEQPINNEIKNVLLSIASYEQATPRLFKRLINKINFSMQIYKRVNTNTTLSQNEINSLFAISCTLEELFRDFYKIIVKNDHLIYQIINFLQNQDLYTHDIEFEYSLNKTHNKCIINTLKENFEILKMVFNTEQGKFWLENKYYRISAYEFIKTHYDEINYSESTNIDFIPSSQNNDKIDPKQFIPIPNQNYEMSKYVITNEWYEEFINDQGYEKSQYWTDMAAHVWLMKNKINSLDEKYDSMLKKEATFFKKKYKEELKKENFNHNLQPIVYITYYEAVAFCKYLTQNDSNYIYDIPTKEQWEYVARGGIENRIYPWGNSWDQNRCNNAQNKLNRTSKIGSFPQGDSKFGISDIAGNVWVWTSTLEKNNLNYLKGGSWNFSDPTYFKVVDNNTQITFYNNAAYQHYDIGFYCIRYKKY